MKRLALAVLTAAVPLLLWASPASAHNSLVEASPAKEAKLAEPPAEVKLRFLASLPADTKLTVVDGEGGSAIGEVTIDGKVISAPFVATEGGEYTVGYELTASDGHTTKKTYTFTLTVEEPVVVVPATEPASEPAGEPTPTALAATTPPERDTPWWPYIGGAALAGLIVGGVITFLRNRGQRA